MLHFDTKRLPLLTGEKRLLPREYLFVAIDDFSRELYAAILPDKTQQSAATFLEQVLEECPYTIECAYSDNGTGQKLTRVRRPQTNGKVECVIKTLLDMWHAATGFVSREHRQRELARFINFYNTVKPHAGIANMTPDEKLRQYFFNLQTTR